MKRKRDRTYRQMRSVALGSDEEVLVVSISFAVGVWVGLLVDEEGVIVQELELESEKDDEHERRTFPRLTTRTRY